MLYIKKKLNKKIKSLNAIFVYNCKDRCAVTYRSEILLINTFQLLQINNNKIVKIINILLVLMI